MSERNPAAERGYWRAAADNFRSSRMLVFAALICALRIAVKFFKIPLTAGLSLTFDCYVNSLGSLVYGPLVGLAVGAVSDTLGYIVKPSGAYFLPFITVEMMSSFLFGLFFWRREPTLPRLLAAKFTVNLVCNIIMTSVFIKWSMLLYYGIEEARAYAVVNLVRIAKNLVLFPAESVLIMLVFRAVLPVLCAYGLAPESGRLRPTRRDYLLAGGLFVLSVALVVFYWGFLKDFISAHNVKLW